MFFFWRHGSDEPFHDIAASESHFMEVKKDVMSKGPRLLRRNFQRNVPPKNEGIVPLKGTKFQNGIPSLPTSIFVRGILDLR